MEPAKIDWKNLTWVFVEDERYEHMNAPKWFDLSAPEDTTIDDVSWFCRPDCNHPQTADDFLKLTPPSKKQANAYKTLLLGEMSYQSDSSIKKRGFTPSPIRMVIEDSENQNPNLSTPLNQHTRTLKAAIKSSSENENPNLSTPINPQTRTLKEAIKSSSGKKKATNEPPRLKSTLSARNLFGGHNIFNQITEFVGELKNKLSSKSFKERGENMELLNEEKKANYSNEDEILAEKERKPLLQVSEARSDRSPFSAVKEKQKLKRKSNDGENTPVPLNMEKVRPKRQEVLSQIRTSPPTPQGFSAPRGPARTTPQKATKSKFMERQILQELKPSKAVQEDDEAENRAPVANFDTKETKPLDLFWLLKPCTPMS